MRLFRQYIGFLMGITILALPADANAQEDLQDIAGFQYGRWGDEWYTTHNGIRGDLVDLGRLVLRLSDKGNLEQFNVTTVGLPSLEITRPRYVEAFYEVRVPEEHDPFQVSRALEQTGAFDTIHFVVYGQVFTPPDDPEYQNGNQWNLDGLLVSNAWDVTTGNSNVIVAVLDEGTDYTHEDLQGGLWSASGYPNHGYDYLDDDEDGTPGPDDDPAPLSADNHGTAAAGIMAARTNNNVGIAGVAGGGLWDEPGVQLMIMRVGKVGQIDEVATAQAIAAAADLGANVINMSIGFLSFEDLTDLKTAIDEAVNDHDAVVVASAGNNAGEPVHDGHENLLKQPARYDNTISVGAVLQNGSRWSESAFGGCPPGGEDCYALDVMAYGGSTLNDKIRTTDNMGAGGDDPGNYTYLGGTSAAAPQVAGIAALIRSIDLSLSWSDVKAILRNTADPNGCIENNPDHPYEEECGKGRVDAYDALVQALDDSDQHEVFDDPGGTLAGTYAGKNIWILAPTSITGTLNLFQDAVGNATKVYVLADLTATSTATVNCGEGAEFFERTAKLIVQSGAQINMNCLNACMLAEEEGTIRFESGVTQSFSNLAFLVNSGGTLILQNDASVTYESTAKPLLVEPGAEFHLFGSAALQLQRSVHLLGEPGNPIRFTQGGTVHVAGNDAASTFEHVSFETTGVVVEDGTSAIFTESAFTDAALTINDGADVTMTDGAEIRLGPGFHAQPGSTFHAYIDPSAPQARLAQAPPAPSPNVAQPTAHEAEPAANLAGRAGEAGAQETLREPAAAVPTAFSLSANYPNPFNPTTTITYALKEDVPVRLTIYNVLGQHVATLVDGFERAGYKSVVWDGRDAGGIAVPSGAYVYRLAAGDFVQARTMLLLK